MPTIQRHATRYPSRNILPLVLLVLSILIYSPQVQVQVQVQAQAVATPGKAEVLAALGRKDLAQDSHLQFQIKPWGASPGSFAALLYLTYASGSMDVGDEKEVVRSPHLQPTLILLQSTSGHLVATAKSEGSNGLGAECRQLSEVQKETANSPAADGDLCAGFDLDLANYRTSATETALGVRTRIHSIYGAGEGDSTQLTLFAVNGQSLKPIFSESVSGSFEERGPNEMNTSKATLQVTTQKTGDHFDLLLTDHRRTERLVDDSSSGHPGRSTARRIFHWNGSKYVESK